MSEDIYYSKEKESRTGGTQPNATSTTPHKTALTTPPQSYTLIASDTTEAGTALGAIVATGHSARVGDLIKLTSGADSGLIMGVYSIGTDLITLDSHVDVGVGVGFAIYRWVPIQVDGDGVVATSGSGGGGGDVNIIEVGGNPVTTTVPVSGTVSVTEPVSVDDNGGSLTVDGTVAVSSVGGTVAVSAASLPLPSGAATEANQSTIIGHVDGIEALLTTIDADTSVLQATGASAQQIQGTGAVGAAAAGNPVQVAFQDWLSGNVAAADLEEPKLFLKTTMGVGL